MNQKNLNQKVRSSRTLWRAWQAIRENGRLSKSKETQDQIRAFDQEAISRIDKIYRKLFKGQYKFDPAIGISQKKKGKSKERPLVMASVSNRVVQRAILDVIQSEENLKYLFNNENSFGGILKKGVGAAVTKAQSVVKNHGAVYYICSDISGFFRDIKRQVVIDELASVVTDEKFLDLFTQAITTELANIEELRLAGKELDFPIQDIGVAQGCCLSPLVGNIYLKEFDKAMNSDDIFCLRYIDDFIILGPSERIVRAKFNQGLRILKSLGLTAYLPNDGSGKATEGKTSEGFDYLGCHVSPKNIRPSRGSWKRMEKEIKDAFVGALQHAADPTRAGQHKMSFPEVMFKSSRKLEGWIKQYAQFCDDHRIIGQWQEALLKEFLEFESQYSELMQCHSHGERAAALGLYDMKSNFDIQRKELEKRRGRLSN